MGKKVNVRLVGEELRDRFKLFEHDLGVKQKDILRIGALYFNQSAVKKTATSKSKFRKIKTVKPSKGGSRRSSKPVYRVTISRPRYADSKYDEKGFRGGSPKGKSYIYRWSRDKSSLARYRKKQYHGAGRAGWWAMSSKIGYSVKGRIIKPADRNIVNKGKLSSIIGKLNDTRVNFLGTRKHIVIKNKTEDITSKTYGYTAWQSALASTNRRLRKEYAILKRDKGKQWQRM